ncbi:hypothetical protein EYF80_032514 [Liparis tanakae]|uniref:Uncharacterized protein n=1 Tax=Liparis tanakae TaxID=230148 RepID=A0A4Z2GVY2_9TELE|nr:hypothetical protein EYF80_032514 [Liparis tanakae]
MICPLNIHPNGPFPAYTSTDLSEKHPDCFTLPDWLSTRAKSVHLSLPRCAKPAQREPRREHTPGSRAKRREVKKVERTLGAGLKVSSTENSKSCTRIR